MNYSERGCELRLAATVWKPKAYSTIVNMFIFKISSHLQLPFIVLLFLFILPICYSNAQEKLKTRNVLFGVQLNDGAKSLLAEVEQLFGKQVREEWLDETDPRYGSGNSKVGDDGTPIIYINPSHGRKIDVIVHELYHFKLRDRGYPVIRWLYPKYMDIEANRAAFAQLILQLHDPILHYIFYSELRAWTINPGKTFEEHTKQALKDHTLVSTITNMDEKAIGLYYFTIRLEISDLVLFKQLIELLEHKQKQPGIEFGKKLTQIVINNNPRSPEADIKTLVDCLNTLYEGSFHFKQHRWTSRQLGKHTQQIAPIEMESLR